MSEVDALNAAIGLGRTVSPPVGAVVLVRIPRYTEHLDEALLDSVEVLAVDKAGFWMMVDGRRVYGTRSIRRIVEVVSLPPGRTAEEVLAVRFEVTSWADWGKDLHFPR